MEHLKVIKSDYHRNGISGEGFNVIIFDWLDPKETQTNMCAFVFKDKGRIAVTNINELGHHNIEFAMGNSWSGEHFETTLRDYIRQETITDKQKKIKTNSQVAELETIQWAIKDAGNGRQRDF